MRNFLAVNATVRFFNGGFCSQLLWFVDGRSLRIVRFHAVFLAVLHPIHGWVVIDTGYGGRFRVATRRWPYRLYRFATPATMAPGAGETLRASGIDVAEVRHVVITHFHADHTGGLRDFPTAVIHHHEDAWRLLAELRPLRQTLAAFLPDLMPLDFPDRSAAIPAAAFQCSGELPFPTHDLFGDGVIKLIDLPGHAPGHLGALVESEGRRILYATDAYWRAPQVKGSIEAPIPARLLQWDSHAYATTLLKLREVQRSGRFLMLACHDPLTQTHVEQSVP
jgi:glyoxylase-like metal-dependent hydrolase (beta-lactamase superfamily II)